MTGSIFVYFEYSLRSAYCQKIKVDGNEYSLTSVYCQKIKSVGKRAIGHLLMAFFKKLKAKNHVGAFLKGQPTLL